MFLLFLWDGTITMFSKGHGLQIRDIGFISLKVFYIDYKAFLKHTEVATPSY